MGGIPCVDFTTWGLCRRLSGPTAILVMMFICLRILLKEAIVIIENVVGFPMDLLERYLGRFYDFTGAVCANTDFAGLPVRRDRRYVVLPLTQVCSISSLCPA